jgi:hypothetical protein
MASFIRNNAGALSGAAIGATLGGFAGGRTKKHPRKGTTSEKSDQKTDKQTALRRRKIIRGAVLGGLTGALYGAGLDTELHRRDSFRDAPWDDYRSRYRGGFWEDQVAETPKELWARLGGRGAPPTTKQEFKAAYRAAARKYHPDLNSGPEAEASMRDLNDAWDKTRGSPWFDKLAGLLTNFWL